MIRDKDTNLFVNKLGRKTQEGADGFSEWSRLLLADYTSKRCLQT